MNGILAKGWLVGATTLVAACAAPPASMFQVAGDCQVRQVGHSGAGTPTGLSLDSGSLFGAPGTGFEVRATESSDGGQHDHEPGTPSPLGVGGVSSGGSGSWGTYGRPPVIRPQGPTHRPLVRETQRLRELARTLLAEGPRLPASYSMSCMQVQGVVKGGWPMAIDYLADGSSSTAVEIHIDGAGQPWVVPLEESPGRHLTMYWLPAEIGTSPLPALVLVRSRRQTPDGMRPGRLQLYGLAAGPGAVASIAIEQIDFGPPLLQPTAQQRASYSFVSKTDFNRVAVEVLRSRNVDGEIQVDLAREFRFDGGISRGTRFGEQPPQTWDGTDARGRVSPGIHQLQVRGWRSIREDGPWAVAWSESAVRVAD